MSSLAQAIKLAGVYAVLDSQEADAIRGRLVDVEKPFDPVKFTDADILTHFKEVQSKVEKTMKDKKSLQARLAVLERNVAREVELHHRLHLIELIKARLVLVQKEIKGLVLRLSELQTRAGVQYYQENKEETNKLCFECITSISADQADCPDELIRKYIGLPEIPLSNLRKMLDEMRESHKTKDLSSVFDNMGPEMHRVFFIGPRCGVIPEGVAEHLAELKDVNWEQTTKTQKEHDVAILAKALKNPDYTFARADKDGDEFKVIPYKYKDVLSDLMKHVDELKMLLEKQ